MPKSLADVLADDDDAAVCSGVYSLIIARYGKHFDLASIPVEQRTAFIVWHTKWLIDNGGFNGFFKAELAIDPDYSHMRAAYETVGCEAATAALSRVFEAYPNRTPPADPAERLRMFVKSNNAVHGALNRDFLKAGNELTEALAAYIRGRAEAFADVEKLPAGYTVATPPAQIVASPAAHSDIVDVKVWKLPHWARAAFFANGARLTFPLWDAAWPESPINYRESVEQGIILAEMCAAQGQLIGDLKAASLRAVQSAEAAAATDPKLRMGGAPPVDPALAVNIALATASALDFIAGDQEADAYEFARAAIEAARRDDLEELVKEHYRRLRTLAREGGWTDRTPVPPEVFRPDFESRGKSWWKRW
jgi:hypothetical protein